MSFLRRFGILILGIVFVIGGAVGYAAWFPQPSFGWSAYAPLTSTTFVPGPALYDWAEVLVVIGLVLVAAWIGHLIGRRQRAR